MRAVQLAKVAAQAEKIRLSQLAGRTATRAVFALIAVIFLTGALIAAHVAIALAIVAYVGPIWATLIVAGGDLVIAVVLGLLAAFKGPGRVEREALEVRRAAQAKMMDSLTLSALILPLVRRTFGRRVIDMILSRMMGKRA